MGKIDQSNWHWWCLRWWCDDDMIMIMRTIIIITIMMKMPMWRPILDCEGLISPTGIDEGKKRGLHDFTQFTFVLVRICYQRDCGQNELNNLEGNRKDWSTQLALTERPKRAEKYIITTNNKFWTILPVTLRGYIEEIPKRVSPFDTSRVSYTVWRGTFPPLSIDITLFKYKVISMTTWMVLIY